VAELKGIYAAERAVAVYPCIRGPTGRPDEDGVLKPWLGVHDECEPAPPATLAKAGDVGH
jgi:hypothetical protein